MITDPAERSRLLSQLQRQVRDRFAPCLVDLFDQLEARLFDLAERSRVASHQHAYFDGLRECRRKRPDIEHDFLESVAASLRVPGATALATEPRALGLVALDELEETLALSSLAERTAARQAVALEALDRRIAMLQNVQRDPDAPPRLSPQLLGTLFRQACQRLDVGIEVRLVAYSLFGQHVFDQLEGMYAEFNRELIAAGVLPAIAAPSPRRASRSTPAPGDRAARPGAPPAASDGVPRARSAGDASRAPAHGESLPAGGDPVLALLMELRALLEPPAAPEASVERLGDQPTLTSRELLQALDRIGSGVDQPRQLKSELLAESRRIGKRSAARLGTEDERTVDLIGMLFDAVRHDPNLPEPLQPVIARLQMPFLKLALLDPGVMNSPEHPARRLVDELGELALGWTTTTDPEGQLLARISQIVDSLLQPHEAGIAAFERAIAELDQHLQIARHRADLAEQRAVEGALGRERLRIARSRVAAMLDRRLSRHAPLPWIRQLLRGPWANYLVLLWLRQGETGESFRQGFAFVDELLWCDEHGQSGLDDARLRSDLEELEDDLRYGLTAVAYHDREIERLASELRQFVQSLLRHAPAPAFLYEIDPRLGSADFSQSWNEPELEDQPDAEAVDPALLLRLRNLAPGTWFEFGGRQGERAKLSWSSPFSGRCLFVNRNGMRVDEIAPERLALEIERGLTRILESTRLLQRSLQGLLERLRAGQGPDARSA